MENLAPCTYYELRIRVKENENATEWLEFKIATDDGPFMTAHLSRAVAFSKTSLIRKIVYKRWAKYDSF